MDPVQKVLVLKVAGVVVPLLFLPLTALTYYHFRRDRQQAEVERVFELLRFDEHLRRVYRQERQGLYFGLAVFYTTVVAACGLTLLFLVPEIEGSASLIAFAEPGEQALVGGPAAAPLPFLRQGSLLVLAVAFLGAFVWGLGYIVRRYTFNDLTPGVYHGLSARMLVASVTALVLFNAAGALTGGDGDEAGITAMIWLGVAFLVGTFPQRGVRWLTDRIPLAREDPHPAVREAPLEMVEGITTYDRMRLQEEDVDTCYDLANKDFVPLILNTPYSARELIDWILQAKLCAHFGEGVIGLREHGVRTLLDLEGLDETQLEELAQNTACTKQGLLRAQRATTEGTDEHWEIERLCDAGAMLGLFWRKEEDVQVEMERRRAALRPARLARGGDGEAPEPAPPDPLA